jgi:hypothetical protein
LVSKVDWSGFLKKGGRGVMCQTLKKASFAERTLKMGLFGFRSIAGMDCIGGKAES